MVKHIILKICLLFFFALFVFSSVTAEPRFVEHIDHYEIEGQDEYDLKDQMAKLGPKNNIGEPIHTETKWDVKWDYKYRETHGRCRLYSIKTKLSITHKTPRWINNENADPDLKKEWELFSQSLTQKEKTLKTIAYKAAKKIEERLVSLGSQSTCSELGRRAEVFSKNILKHYKSLESATSWRNQNEYYNGIFKH